MALSLRKPPDLLSNLAPQQQPGCGLIAVVRGLLARSGRVVLLVLLCASPAPAQSRLGNGRTVLALSLIHI